MPKVPEAQVGAVDLAPMPAPRQSIDATPATFGQAAAQQQDAGRALMNLGQQGAQMLIDQQNIANQVRVDDARNQLKEAEAKLTFDPQDGYTQQTGINALQRPGGMPLSDEYQQKLKQHIDDISAGLGNDVQRRAFKSEADPMLTSFGAQVMAHQDEQFKSYAVSTNEGTVKIAQNDLALYYNNPAKIDSGLLSIKGAVYKSAQLLGKSATWAEAQSRGMASNALATGMEAALTNGNADQAQALLTKYSGEMDADDILRVQGKLQTYNATKTGLVAGTQAVNEARTTVQPTDFSRLVNLVSKQESQGHETDAAGNTVTSPKGAQGSMQVMPATNKDPGFGVVPAKDDSPEERARVGRDYLSAMLARYNGNLPQTLAAYNAGPGAVDAALKNANGGPGWLAKMPAETQQYVASITNAYGLGAGAQPMLTLDQVTQRARALAGPNPVAQKNAEEEATRQYNALQASKKQADEASVANAMRALEQNGGSYASLPVSITSTVPPEKVDELLIYGKKIALGTDITDPATYQKLSDQSYLTRLTPDQLFTFKPKLSESDYQHFVTTRASLLDGKSESSPQNLNTTAINSALDNRLLAIGMKIRPQDGSDEAAHMGTIRQFVNESLLAQQRDAGHKFSAEETQKAIDSLFVKSAQFRDKLFFGGYSAPRSERLITMNYGDIPEDSRDKITTAMQQSGIQNPSEQEVLLQYLRLKTGLVHGNKH